MIFSENRINTTKKIILVAPLDWGLGHATRCIPIIQELLLSNNEVIIAAELNVKTLLQTEFPSIKIIPLRGYRIKYSAQKNRFLIKLLFQIPKIILTFFHEKSWLNTVIKKYNIDVVISDNRPGLYHDKISTVYITHQLCIKTGNQISEKIATGIHQYFIKKFTHCWVPDFEWPENIAGALSHPPKLFGNVTNLGAISRLHRNETEIKAIDLLILLSGPEPQRSIFENILLQQLKNYTGKLVFVRGLPDAVNFSPIINNIIAQQPNLVFKNHLAAKDLEREIQQSKLVICRCGYSTVMDLLKLKQKAVLVPTPGQTEQEYLASYLSTKKLFTFINQDELLLEALIKNANTQQNNFPDLNMELYKKKIQEFLLSLQSK